MNERLLIIRASGGLSNRLQAIIAGVAYCLLTGRTLCVDWRDGMYSDDFTDMFSRWFTVRGVPTVPIETALARAAAKPKSVYPPFWRDKIADAMTIEDYFDNDHLHPDNIARTCIEWRQLEHDSPIIVAWGWNWTPALALAPHLRADLPDFAGLTDKNVVHRLARTYLVPAPDLVAEADAFMAAVPVRSTPYIVGIHIRHTDLQSPVNALLAALHTVANKSDVVFLATDNAHIVRAVRRLFPYMVCREKYFSPTGEPLHSWTPGVSSATKGRDALLDMLLLARCQHIIHYARSSFARIPIALSGLPDAHIHTV